jgi:gluconokinase
MKEKFPRSPYDVIGGLVYFPRMLDKIRIHAAGNLPVGYHEHLGDGFDGRCLRFLSVSYEDVKKQALANKSDQAVLDWCFAHGRKPGEEEIEAWSAFMMKRGWRDEVSDRIAFRLKEAGLEARDAECATMFDFIDLDEERTPPDLRKWEPPRIGTKPKPPEGLRRSGMGLID